MCCRQNEPTYTHINENAARRTLHRSPTHDPWREARGVGKAVSRPQAARKHARHITAQTASGGSNNIMTRCARFTRARRQQGEWGDTGVSVPLMSGGKRGNGFVACAPRFPGLRPRLAAAGVQEDRKNVRIEEEEESWRRQVGELCIVLQYCAAASPVYAFLGLSTRGRGWVRVPVMGAAAFRGERSSRNSRVSYI